MSTNGRPGSPAGRTGLLAVMRRDVDALKVLGRRFGCWLRGGRHRVAAIDNGAVVAVCRSCSDRVSVPIDQAPRPSTTVNPLAAAYDLVGALAADDLDGANAALPATTQLHVAVAALVLAGSPPDLRRALELLALQAQIDAIDIGDAS